jgi:hypothetical protein
LMRFGIIPESVCEDCNDISRRLTADTEEARLSRSAV